MLLRLLNTKIPFQTVKSCFTLRNPCVRNYFKDVLKTSKSSVKPSFQGKRIIGLSLGAGLAFKSCLAVRCDSNRLADVRLVKEPIKFDWARFWYYLKGHLWKLLGAVIAALAVAYLNINIPSLLGQLVNALSSFTGSEFRSTDSFFDACKKPASGLLFSYLGQSFFTFIYILLLSKIGEQMACEIRKDLFHQIIIQDIEFFDANRTGELVNRLSADVQEFKSSFKQTISGGLRSIAQLIGGAISLFIISPQLATIALLSVPTAVFIGSFLGRSLRELSKQTQAQLERATSVCQEALSNIRTVRSSACEHIEMMLFEQEVIESSRLSQELGVGIAFFQSLTNMFLNCMVLGTLYFGGHLMSNNSISAGQLMAFLVASQGVQRSLSQGSILMGTLIRGLTSGARVFEYMAVEPKIDLINGLVIPDDELKGEIRFVGVSFSYPTRSEQVVLEDFNLTLKPGQTVALVGSSGSGKSTVASLLERFYEPTKGDIYIDGVNLKEISPVWLRSQVIGFIEQQPILFATTIMENIKYGRQNATEEEVYEVSKLSQSDEFIKSLPEGYETKVGERGGQLSGGQRQRIAIARALLKRPTILILDEATSALDSASESEVQKALDRAIENRTTLVIAHRLSTIKNADVIVVIDQGRIKEVGNHDNLMLKMGLYYELVKKQERQKEMQEDRTKG